MFSYWSTPEVLPDGNFKNLNVENASIRNLSLEMSNASTATVDGSDTFTLNSRTGTLTGMGLTGNTIFTVNNDKVSKSSIVIVTVIDATGGNATPVITKVNPTNGAFTFTVLPIVGTTVTGLSCNFVVL
jgi:hypothetical protein